MRIAAVAVLLVLGLVRSSAAVDPADGTVIYAEPLHIPKIGKNVTPYRQYFWQWADDDNARRTERGTLAARPAPTTQLISKIYLVTDCTTAACTAGGGSIKCVTKLNESGTTWDSGPCDGTTSTAAWASLTGPGTNTTAGAMTVGTGASLTFSGTGTINASTVTCTSCIALGSEVSGTLPLANLTDDDITAGNCLVSGGGGAGTPNWATCPGGGGGSVSITCGSGLTCSPSPILTTGSVNLGTVPVGNGGTNVNTATDDQVLVGNGTTWQSKAVPLTTAAGVVLQYDTAANTFGAHTLIDADIPDTLTLNLPAGLLTGITDDALLVGTAASTAAYKNLPTTGTNGCSGTTDKLLYNTTTNAFSCGVDAGAGGGMTSWSAIPDTGAAQVITNGVGLAFFGSDGMDTYLDTTNTIGFRTNSLETLFLRDGGVTSLTCGVGGRGKAQVLDSGAFQWCDGATTAVLRSTDDFVKLTPTALQTVAGQLTMGSGTDAGVHIDADIGSNGIGLFVEKGVGTPGVAITGPAPAFVSVVSSGGTDSASIMIANHNTSAGIDSVLGFRHSRGTYASPTASPFGDFLGTISFQGYGAGADPWGATTGNPGIEAYVAEPGGFTATARGSSMSFYVTKIGTVTDIAALGLNGDTSMQTPLQFRIGNGITAFTNSTDQQLIDMNLTATKDGSAGFIKLIQARGTVTQSANPGFISHKVLSNDLLHVLDIGACACTTSADCAGAAACNAGFYNPSLTCATGTSATCTTGASCTSGTCVGAVVNWSTGVHRMTTRSDGLAVRNGTSFAWVDEQFFDVLNSGTFANTVTHVSYWSNPTFGAGTSSNRLGVVISDTQGTGVPFTNIGIDVQPLTKGTTNLAIRTQGMTASEFGGAVAFLKNLGNNPGIVNGLLVNPVLSATSGTFNLFTLVSNPAITVSGTTVLRALETAATTTLTGTFANTVQNINAHPTMTVTGAGAAPFQLYIGTTESPTFASGSGIDAGNLSLPVLFQATPTISAVGAAGRMTATTLIDFNSGPSLATDTAGGIAKITTMKHFNVTGATNSGPGTETLDTEIGIDIGAFALAGVAKFPIQFAEQAILGTPGVGKGVLLVETGVSTNPARLVYLNEAGHTWRMGYASMQSGTDAGANLSTSAADNFMPEKRGPGAGTTTCANADTPVPGALKVYAMACGLTVAPGGSAARTVRLNKNCSTTGPLCTFTSALRECIIRDETGFAFAAGDTWSLSTAVTLTPAASELSCTVFYNLDAF